MSRLFAFFLLGLKGEVMFAFFKKAMPAAEVANELWGGISGNRRVPELAALALETTAQPDAAALEQEIKKIDDALDAQRNQPKR